MGPGPARERPTRKPPSRVSRPGIRALPPRLRPKGPHFRGDREDRLRYRARTDFTPGGAFPRAPFLPAI